MVVDESEAAPLTRDEFYALYRGGLGFAEDDQRLKASYTLLLAGRLGLQPAELCHLHEDWIDWDRGTVRVPAHDPCACSDCWERARQAKETGDNRPLRDIVTESQWQPHEGGARTVPFGWSRRITAVLATVAEQYGWLDDDTDWLVQFLETVVDRAEGLDPDSVTFTTLRATAGRFFAEAGCDQEAVADLLGVTDEAARRYTRRFGTAPVRDLTTRLGDGTVPTPARQFPVACDPTPFENEPFDTSEFDTAWRVERATERATTPDLLGTPLPADPPMDVNMYSPTSHELPTHLDPGSDWVTRGGASSPTVTSLPEWRQDAERERGGALAETDPTAATRQPAAGRAPVRSGQAPSGGAETAATGSEADDDGAAEETATVGSGQTMAPREQVTDPIVAEVSTRFAAADLEGGSPVSGQVLLGQEELLFVAESGAQLPLEHDAVTDVAVDYTPEGLENVFESTVGVSYERDGNNRLSVVELPGKKQVDFSTGLLRLLLDGTTVTATHPARKGGRVTEAEPRELTLSVDDRQLAFEDDEKTAFRIRLSDLIHVERGKQTVDGETRRSLSVRHCTSDQVSTTEVSTGTDRLFTLFERYMMRDYRRRQQQLQQIELSAQQKEILVALYSTGGAMDISMMIDMPDDEFTEVMESLQRAGLTRSGSTGAELTGLGQMAVSDKVDDVNI